MFQRLWRALKRFFLRLPPVLVLRFLNAVVRRFREDRCTQVAGSLTFTTLLALVPLMTVALSIVTAFPAFASLSDLLSQFIALNFMPEATAKMMTVYLPQFSGNATRLTAVGVAFLAVTAIMLVLTIDRVFNSIWRVGRARSLAARVLIYWAVLTVGPILIGASLALSSWLLSLMVAAGLMREYSALILAQLPFFLSSLGFTLLYRTVPNRDVHMRDAVVGGVVAGFGFEAAKAGFAEFIAHFSSHQAVYGAFAILPILLLWIYLSWLIVLSGAIVTAVLPNLRAGGFALGRDPASQFAAAVKLLKLLVAAHQKGEVLKLGALSRELGLSWEGTESLLDCLEAAGWVCKVSGKGWLLRRDSGSISLSEVFRQVVFDPEKARGEDIDREFDTLLRATTAIVDREMDFPLASLFAPGGKQQLRALERVG